MQRIGEIPCARSSLLSAIASGTGIGVIRGLSVGVYTFCIVDSVSCVNSTAHRVQLGGWDVHGGCTRFMVSIWPPGFLSVLGANVEFDSSRFVWDRTICQKNIRDERRRMQQVVEELPKRMVSKNKEATSSPT